jgi:hypothetical protein
MSGQPKTTFLYLDDGHPESRDYDDNYVPIDPTERRSLLRALLRLPPRAPAPAPRPPMARRIEGRPQPA